MAGEDLAQELLGVAPAVDVGRVEEVDAQVEGVVDARPGVVQVDAPAVGEPRAQADDRDDQFAVAEFPVLHVSPFLPRPTLAVAHVGVRDTIGATSSGVAGRVSP